MSFVGGAWVLKYADILVNTLLWLWWCGGRRVGSDNRGTGYCWVAEDALLAEVEE